MYLAEKIVKLRKEKGWSQEELADKVNVSRQAVSKWESMQTLPDIDNIVQLAEIFGVSTDYLLKNDDGELSGQNEGCEQPVTAPQEERQPPLKRVGVQEALSYIGVKGQSAWKVALGVALCILSPICLILLSGFATTGGFGVSEPLAAGVGIGVLLAIVAIAVGLFVWSGLKEQPFEYVKEPFILEDEAKAVLQDRQTTTRKKYIALNVLGVCACILSPVSLFFTPLIPTEAFASGMVCITLAVIAIGVALFVCANVPWEGMEEMLKQGEGKSKTQAEKRKEKISSLYWSVVTAIYLVWSFLSGAWGITWVIWPLAGVLSGIVESLLSLIKKDDGKNEKDE